MESENNSNTVKIYSCNYYLYGISFQYNKFSQNIILGVSSMETSNNNIIKILSINEDNNNSQNNFNEISTIKVEYPITQIEFSKNYNNLFATTSDSLRIYSLSSKIIQNIEFKYNAPLTSLSWKNQNSSLIGFSSINSTVSINDINKEKEINKLIANDKECYKINFDENSSCFYTCGADGTIRLFDLRKINKYNKIYESNDNIIKIDINQSNNNYLSFITLNSNEINIIDLRNTNKIYKTLFYHNNSVNNCIWIPESDYCLLSVSDDKNAIFWNIQNLNGNEALMNYKSDYEIENCSFCYYKNWVGITNNKEFRLLKLK
jgi:WD repeat-containing protein 68